MSKTDSIAPGFANKTQKPQKPYPEFPLFPHVTKRWAKKIRGKLYYFGPWNDPGGALKKYEEQKDALHSGRKPREVSAGVTIKDLCNAYLNHQKAKLGRGDLSPRTWKNYRETAELIVTTFGKSRLVSDLRPDDFTALHTVMSKKWGPVRVRNYIQQIRSVFKYALDSELITVSIRFGPGFERPSKEDDPLGPCEEGATEIRTLVDGTPMQAKTVRGGTALRAMILLGVNCGFGNADCGTLPHSALDLEGGWVNYHRPKTGITRRCPLWPETVEALRAVLAERPAPSDPADAELDGWTRGLFEAKLADNSWRIVTDRLRSEARLEGVTFSPDVLSAAAERYSHAVGPGAPLSPGDRHVCIQLAAELWPIVTELQTRDWIENPTPPPELVTQSRDGPGYMGRASSSCSNY